MVMITNITIMILSFISIMCRLPKTTMYMSDMGLTKLIEHASVTVHNTEGTYAHMAPECF